MDRSIYAFGPFWLSSEQGSLMRDGQRVALGQRAFEILLLLLEHGGEVVSTADIVARVWPRTIVDENNLRVHIASLRKVLSDRTTEAPYILNVPGRGYRFAAIVERRQRKSDKTEFPADLPVPLTTLIGREPFIRRVLDALARARLITIVGPGGVGKTSVALAIAHELIGQFEDGRHFVDLSALTNPDSIPEAIAAAMSISDAPAMPLPAVLSSLRSRNCAIVLDNCEHVITRAAEVAEAILKAAPNVHIIATSREALRAEGEYIYQLAALDVPPPVVDDEMTSEEVVIFSAVQLFCERVAAVVEGFRVTDTDALLVAEVCRKLEGNPLAIELAAAQVATFGVAGLLDALTDGLAILANGRRTYPARHTTMRATLDWSFELLSDTEKLVFGRLGVFTGEFTRESALLVVPDKGLTVPMVVRALTGLIAKSLVAVARREGRTTFRLHDLTRAYALERIHDDPFACEVFRRHAGCLYAPVESWLLKHCADEPGSYSSDVLVGSESQAALCSSSPPEDQ